MDFFFWIFLLLQLLFVKQNILLRTPYIQKVRDPTFSRPKSNVRRPSLQVKKILNSKSMSHLQFFTWFFFLLPPLTCPLRIFFISGDFVQFLLKKKIKKDMPFRQFFNSPSEIFKNNFIVFFSNSVYNCLIFLLHILELRLIHK